MWLKYLPQDRVLPFGDKDNFWQMAETGPCGMCTELHYDLSYDIKRDASTLVNKDDPSVIELWNNVFIQYNRTPTSLDKLDKCHIDVGGGFERIVTAMSLNNNKSISNYDNDIFLPIINLIKMSLTRKHEENNLSEIALRICADHFRTISYSVADAIGSVGLAS